MNTDPTTQERQINLGRWRAVSYALVTAMLTCGALTLVSALHQLQPDWHLFHIELIAFIVTLDRLYVHQKFKRLTVLSGKWFARFIGQWVVLAVFIRLSISLFSEAARDPRGIIQSPSAFFAFFFTFDFIFALILAGLFWLAAGQFAELLDDLSDQEAIVRLSLNYNAAESRTPRQRLVSLIIMLGGVLVILTALARVDLRAVFKTGLTDLTPGLPAFVGAGGSTLLYFLCALVLLSLSQFLELYTVWSLQHIPVNRVVIQRWPWYSLLFLGVVTLIISLLPTQYGLGLIGLLNYVLNIILYLILLLAQLLLLLTVLTVTLILQIFNLPPPAQTIMRVMPSLPQIQTQQLETVPVPASWELARTILLWVALAAVLIFAVSQYAHLHRELFKGLRRGRGQNILAWFWRLFGGVKIGLDKIVEAGRARLQRRRSASSSYGYMSLRRLDPRQRVRFFYLALIRRGAESGLSRDAAQTPQEYAATLDRALPETAPEIDALTDEFIKARYTRADVDAQEASQVQSLWERIKKVLQDKKAGSGK
jgi:hypothetical protein